VKKVFRFIVPGMIAAIAVFAVFPPFSNVLAKKNETGLPAVPVLIQNNDFSAIPKWVKETQIETAKPDSANGLPAESAESARSSESTLAADIERFLNLNPTMTFFDIQNELPFDIDAICLPVLAEFELENGVTMKGVGVETLSEFTRNYFGREITIQELNPEELDGLLSFSPAQNGNTVESTPQGLEFLFPVKQSACITFVGRCYSTFTRKVNSVVDLGGGVYRVDCSAVSEYGEAFPAAAVVKMSLDSVFGYHLLYSDMTFYF